jgi:superfamily II DNA/RNA helicase
MKSFNELGVSSFLTDKLKERSIVNPTAVQSLVIPDLLAEKNIIFRSETGTGKTFAYLLPVLEKILKERSSALNTQIHSGTGMEFLIIAPTLELCTQIKGELDFLLNDTEIKSLLLIGSVNIDRQVENLKKTKPVVAVGNPGRLLMLAKMRKLRLNNLKFLVLDEADRLTSQESIDETKELLNVIERSIKNQENDNLCVAACSATVGKKTGTQLGRLFINAEIVESCDHEILRERIEHWALFSEKRRKVQTLRSLLSALKNNTSKGSQKRFKALVFTSRGDEAALLLTRLQHHKIAAAGLFGKISKKALSGTERKAALDSFRQGSVDVLVCTDLAARGLDIPGITHVIALDVPSDSEIYIHRSGRTGRAGKRGIMITIGDETQMHLLASLEKKLKIRVQPKELYGGQVCVPLPIEE